MIRSFVFSAIVVAIVLGTPCLVSGDDDRPCGAEKSNSPFRYLVPQGAGGADFKPACRKHDACYETPCANKQECDRAFLRDMQAACNCADHPLKCRFTARMMYFAVKVGGKKAFDESQAQARRGR